MSATSPLPPGEGQGEGPKSPDLLPPIKGWERLWYPEPKRTGWLSGLLAPLSLAYGAAVATRTWLYRAGLFRPARVEGLFVISVGNLTVGGSGKTPAVIALAERLLGQGRKVAVLSRGYGRTERAPVRVTPGDPPDRTGDEPLLIARRCPEAIVLVGSDRVALAHQARALGAEVALLDDGMQHRRLGRDLELVVVDGAVGFGNGRLLPAGPLREPLSALSRADLFWVRTSEAGLPPELTGRPHLTARHVPSALRDPQGGLHPASALAGRRVLALSGIARPNRFHQTLTALGCELVGALSFPDHHRFEPAELSTAEDRARALGACLVTTEKDQVRLPVDFPCWTLRISAELLGGAALLDERLSAVGQR